MIDDDLAVGNEAPHHRDMAAIRSLVAAQYHDGAFLRLVLAVVEPVGLGPPGVGVAVDLDPRLGPREGHALHLVVDDPRIGEAAVEVWRRGAGGEQERRGQADEAGESGHGAVAGRNGPQA